MKKILLLLAVVSLALTGCQTMSDNHPANSASNRVDWTYGHGSIGLP